MPENMSNGVAIARRPLRMALVTHGWRAVYREFAQYPASSHTSVNASTAPHVHRADVSVATGTMTSVVHTSTARPRTRKRKVRRLWSGGLFTIAITA